MNILSNELNKLLSLLDEHDVHYRVMQGAIGVYLTNDEVKPTNERLLFQLEKVTQAKTYDETFNELSYACYLADNPDKDVKDIIADNLHRLDMREIASHICNKYSNVYPQSDSSLWVSISNNTAYVNLSSSDLFELYKDDNDVIDYAINHCINW